MKNELTEGMFAAFGTDVFGLITGEGAATAAKDKPMDKLMEYAHWHGLVQQFVYDKKLHSKLPGLDHDCLSDGDYVYWWGCDLPEGTVMVSPEGE